MRGDHAILGSGQPAGQQIQRIGIPDLRQRHWRQPTTGCAPRPPAQVGATTSTDASSSPSTDWPTKRPSHDFRHRASAAGTCSGAVATTPAGATAQRPFRTEQNRPAKPLIAADHQHMAEAPLWAAGTRRQSRKISRRDAQRGRNVTVDVGAACRSLNTSGRPDPPHHR
jgi:hypothetical protein